MVTIEICMGSSCFLRGSGRIVERFRELLAEYGLEQRIVLKGSFCKESCTIGVTIVIDDRVFTRMQLQDVDRLFHDEVLPRLERGATG